MSADETRIGDDGVQLIGNARIQLDGSKHPNVIGDKIQISNDADPGEIMVDGVKLNFKLEF